jgi:hypothetical protein
VGPTFHHCLFIGIQACLIAVDGGNGACTGVYVADSSIFNNAGFDRSVRTFRVRARGDAGSTDCRWLRITVFLRRQPLRRAAPIASEASDSGDSLQWIARSPQRWPNWAAIPVLRCSRSIASVDMDSDGYRISTHCSASDKRSTMHQRNRIMMIAALLFIAAHGGQASAQSSGGPYRIEMVVMAGGGDPIAGGSFQITSTLGQAATTTLSGASYTLFGGFWRPVGSLAVSVLFADGFE